MLRRVSVLAGTLVLILFASIFARGAGTALADGPGGVITPGAGPVNFVYTVTISGLQASTPLTLSTSFDGGQSWVDASSALSPNGLTTDSKGSALAKVNVQSMLMLAGGNFIAFANAPSQVVFSGSSLPPSAAVNRQSIGFEIVMSDGTSSITWNAAAFTPTGRTETPIIPSSGLLNCNFALAQWNAATPRERAALEVLFDTLRGQCPPGLIPLAPPPAELTLQP